MPILFNRKKGYSALSLQLHQPDIVHQPTFYDPSRIFQTACQYSVELCYKYFLCALHDNRRSMVAELHSNSDASMFMSTADAEQFDVLAHQLL